jgi:hypothetical protein
MSSDVFIISSACDPAPPAVLRQAVERAGVSLSRVQDVTFGLDGASPPDLDSLTRAAGLACPSVGVSSSMRALFFAAAAILSDDIQLGLVAGLQPEACAAFLLASPEMVGLLNLLPRARLAARSLAGPDAALVSAGLAAGDIQLAKTGDHAALLLNELLGELESQSARWGMLTVSPSVLLVERI